MVFDLLSVIPTLASNQRKSLYIFKLIRFLKIGKTYNAISGATKQIIQYVGSGLSKAQVEQVNSLINMIIIAFQALHILSTAWVSLAKMSTCSWVE